jgi:hypothetical protein
MMLLSGQSETAYTHIGERWKPVVNQDAYRKQPGNVPPFHSHLLNVSRNLHQNVIPKPSRDYEQSNKQDPVKSAAL